MPPLKVNEKDVLRACVDFLELHRVCYVRMHPVKPVSRNGETFFTKVRESQRGAPDLIILLPNPKGFCYAVAAECKSSIGKLSKEQEAFKERWLMAGGIYQVIRSVEDLMMLRVTET